MYVDRTLRSGILGTATVAVAAAIYARRLLPRWSSACLVVGLLFGLATVGAPDGLRMLAVGLATLGLAGLGAALIPVRLGSPAPLRAAGPPPADPPRRRSAPPAPRPLAPKT